MKVFFAILFLGLLSLNAKAQTRGQTLEELRDLSDSLHEETYSTSASQIQLEQARELMHEAYGILSTGRNTSEVICARARFGYVPTNTRTDATYGDNVSDLVTCQRMLPPRGAKAMCAKARFGYQFVALAQNAFIGDGNFSELNDCLRLAPRIGQTILCAKARFGYKPYHIGNLQGLGEHVSDERDCMALLPRRGSNLMCVKATSGYQPIDFTNGRSIGGRTSNLSDCHRMINQN